MTVSQLNPKNSTFKIGDIVVYPTHGVGLIEAEAAGVEKSLNEACVLGFVESFGIFEKDKSFSFKTFTKGNCSERLAKYSFVFIALG